MNLPSFRLSVLAFLGMLWMLFFLLFRILPFVVVENRAKRNNFKVLKTLFCKGPPFEVANLRPLQFWERDGYFLVCFPLHWMRPNSRGPWIIDSRTNCWLVSTPNQTEPSHSLKVPCQVTNWTRALSSACLWKGPCQALSTLGHVSPGPGKESVESYCCYAY